MKNIIVEGHRGFCAKYPENTLISFEAAIDLGVDCFEFDVWLSKDGVPVIQHDCLLTRTCKVDKCIVNMTLKEIKEELEPCYEEKFGDKFKGMGLEVLTLEELLTFVKSKRPNMPLGVEIKTLNKEHNEGCVDKTVELLKKFGFFENCWFYCFDAETVKYIKEKYNGRTMGYPEEQMKNWFEGAYDFYDEIGLSMVYVKSDQMDKFRAMNLPMHHYCADTLEDVLLCIENGADLITANDPRPLMKHLGRTK